MTEIEAFVILASIPGLGNVKIRLLLQHFGSALAILQAPISQIQALPGFKRIIPYWNQWRTSKAWQHDLTLLNQHKVQLIPFTSPQFPKLLLEVADHPALIYVRGELKPQDDRCIAIVGTRQSSIYGNEMAEMIGKDLAAHGFTVVSGLARGIDTAAHQGALKSGRTLAVIGSGLAKIYPSENQALAEAITYHGALISELPMSTPPDRRNFPQRNRIVSGITIGTLLIEAPLKSGAMITMDKAHQHKRKLFALPGRADSESFKGNHLLIKSGKAHLVESAADILSHFQELPPVSVMQNVTHQKFALDMEEQVLLNKMPNQEMTIDELSILTLLPVYQLHRILMGLVLKKIVREFPGKIYKKLAAGNAPKRHN